MMGERNMTVREELIRLEVEIEAIEKDLAYCLVKKPNESIESIRILIGFSMECLKRAKNRCEFIKGKIPL